MYDSERHWSLSFAGCGFLGFYHVGATLCLSERAPHLLRDARTFFGCSAGALHAVAFVCSLPLGASTATTQAPRAGRGCSTWGIGNTFRGCPKKPVWRALILPGAVGHAPGDPGPVTWRGISRVGQALEHLLPGPRPAPALWFETGPPLESYHLGYPGAGGNEAGLPGPLVPELQKVCPVWLWLVSHGGCRQEEQKALRLEHPWWQSNALVVFRGGCWGRGAWVREIFETLPRSWNGSPDKSSSTLSCLH